MESIKTYAIVFIAVMFCIGITTNTVSGESYPIVSRGESFNISATLFTNGTYGIPLSNQIVYFYDQTWNTLMATTETDVNGIASINHVFPIGHPLGNTLVNITFRGNATLALAPTCQWLTLTVTSLTDIDVYVSKTEFAPNDNLEFSVLLVDDITNPVDLANLTILCDGKSIFELQTNETGQGSISIFLDSMNFSLGQHTIEIRYEGDFERFFRGSSSFFEFEINQIPTEFEILSLPISPIMLTKTWNTTLRVISEEGPIAIDTVRVLLDGHYFDTITTDAEGYLFLNLYIQQSFTIGNHTLTFEYLGSNRYSSSLVDISLSVGSSIYLNVTPSDYAEIGRNLTLEIYTFDAYSRPLSDGFIEIIDQDTNTSLITPLSNQSTIIVRFPITGEKGPRELYITVRNGVLLTNNSIILNLDIWTRPTVEIVSSNILGFASPQQTIFINTRLEDYRGPLSNRRLHVILPSTNDTYFILTEIDGSAIIEFQSPTFEGYYGLHILYEGNESDYELSYYEIFSFTVSQAIPIEVNLQDYEIIAPLALIRVRLQLIALNGSYPERLLIRYNWLSKEGNILSGENGITEFNLPIPSISGIHILYYETENMRGLEASSGIIYIITTSEDANSSEGIGFYGLITVFASSLGISTVPLVRRRFLIG